MVGDNNIIGYTATGVPIYNTAPQATPRMTYQIPQMQSQQTSVNNAQQSDMIFVDGYIEAKSYRVAPNRAVPLWDSEEGSNLIYVKSADANGVPQKMRVLRYEDVTDEFDGNTTPAKQVITIDMVTDLIESKAEEIINRKMDEMKPKTRNDSKSYYSSKRNGGNHGGEK